MEQEHQAEQSRNPYPVEPAAGRTGLPGTVTDERELSRLWENAVRPGCSFRTLDGRRVAVVSPGRRNSGQGPDYHGAVLRIDGRLTTGDIELHLTEREWFAHGHQHDPAYRRVILHVLARAEGTSRLGIPTVMIPMCSGEARPDSERAVSLPLAMPDCAAGGGSGEGGDAPLLFAKLAWERLYRRVAEVLAADAGLPTDDRLQRAFVRLTFDALGYRANRGPMREVARRMLEREEELRSASAEDIVARVFALSGIARDCFWKESDGGAAAMCPSPGAGEFGRREPGKGGPQTVQGWNHAVRPANSPARRLFAGGMLLAGLYHDALLERLERELYSDRSWGAIIRMLTFPSPQGSPGKGDAPGRGGNKKLTGTERGRDIAVNALLPVMLAGAVLRCDTAGIVRLCERYRSAPGLATNAVLRRVHRGLPPGVRLQGAFWQQGGMEYARRWLPEIEQPGWNRSGDGGNGEAGSGGGEKEEERGISEPVPHYSAVRSYHRTRRAGAL